jgi:lipoyl-dependent peroxiredoxin
MAARKGSAWWKGDLASGSGELMIGEGAWTGRTLPRRVSTLSCPASAKARARIQRSSSSRRTPPASRWRWAWRWQKRDSHPASSERALAFISASSTVRRPSSRSTSKTEGDVPGLDDQAFRELAAEAKATCIISRALGGVEQIELDARSREARLVSEPPER